MTASREVPRWPVRGNAVALVALPVVLALVHYVIPPSLHQRLVFHLDHPTLLAAWGSSYVHLSDHHLTSNLVGYAVAVVPAWTIAAYRGHRRRFWLALLAFLLFVPFVATGVSYVVFARYFRVSGANFLGFSAVVAALFGLLFAQVVAWVAALTTRLQGVAVGVLISLLGLTWVLQRGGDLPLWLVGVVALGVVALSYVVLPGWVWRSPDRVGNALARYNPEVPLLFVGASFVVVSVPMLVEVQWVHAHSASNVFAHVGGFVFGVVWGLVEGMFRTAALK